MTDWTRELADQAMIRRAADLYALGADRRDKALWRSVMAQDYLLEGPGFTTRGREANLASIDLLTRMFRRTQHRVHQLVATIEGDDANGETYCTADHLLHDRDAVLTWAIRYQDRWRREEDGMWRFVHRRLIVDWEETRSVTLGAAA